MENDESLDLFSDDRETGLPGCTVFIRNVPPAGGGELLMPDQGHPVLLLEGWGGLRATHVFTALYCGGGAHSCPSCLERLLLSTATFPATDLSPLETLKLNGTLIHSANIY